jgi:hypothetical protein
MPWLINPRTAMVTALAAGGIQPNPNLLPGDPNLTALDLPENKGLQTIAAAGTLTITWPAAPTRGQVNAIAAFSTDPANTQIETRVNGVAVEPYLADFGPIGTMEQPTMLSVPIVLEAGDVFELVMTNLSAGNIDMQARTQGWIV